jgi:hypothetical protein
VTDERFNELVNGPLSHQMVPFTISRLVLALREVVIRTGEAGDRALEEHCAARQRQDHDADEDWGG